MILEECINHLEEANKMKITNIKTMGMIIKIKSMKKIRKKISLEWMMMKLKRVP